LIAQRNSSVYQYSEFAPVLIWFAANRSKLVANVVARAEDWVPGPKRIGKRDVEALFPGEIVWDSAVSGFAARRQSSAAVTYILKYRNSDGRQRWHTIGRHGAPWTPDGARKQATILLGSIAMGRDPSAEKGVKLKAITVADLCDQYVKDVEAGRVLSKNKTPKRASTLAVDKGRIIRHIVPLLGRLPMSSVKRLDVERFLHDVSEGRTACIVKSGVKRGLARVTGGKTAANRAVGLLGEFLLTPSKKDCGQIIRPLASLCLRIGNGIVGFRRTNTWRLARRWTVRHLTAGHRRRALFAYHRMASK